MSGDTPAQSEFGAQLEALREVREITAQPERGWLRAVRSALGLSQSHVAGGASMTRQAYADLEAAEERGAISLNSLRRAAEAMDCELVYVVVPRGVAATIGGQQAEGPGRDGKQLETIEPSTSEEAQDDNELPVELR